MKKIFLTASFVLASLGVFASNSDVHSNNIIVAKNNMEVVNIPNKNLSGDFKAVPCSNMTIDLGIIAFYYVWC